MNTSSQPDAVSTRRSCCQFDAAVIEITRKRIPEVECIVDGRGGLGLRRQLCESSFQPSSHAVEQWPGPSCANGAAFIGRLPLDLLLDQVESGDMRWTTWVATGELYLFISRFVKVKGLHAAQSGASGAHSAHSVDKISHLFRYICV